MPYKIFIAIPSLRCKVHCGLMLTLLEWATDPLLSIKIKVYPFMNPVDGARNLAVKDFLESECDILFFIDDDIIPPRNAIKDLIRFDKSIIAPICYTLQNDVPIPVAAKNNEHNLPCIYHGTEVEEVDIIGGVHLVKREVYEVLGKRPYKFKYDENGILEHSEDYVFSKKCKEAGFKLYTHFGVRCKHAREIDAKLMYDLSR